MNIVVTGSIAFDYLMSFPGKFTEHFLPEHMHRVSLSFLVDTMDKRRGGCAPNIAYTLALLGERPRLMATAGPGLRRLPPLARGGRRRHVARASRWRASSPRRSSAAPISDNNQIASFYTGAMANAGELSFRDVPDCGLAIISPNDPGAMVQYAEECRTLGDSVTSSIPASSARACPATSCATACRGATIVICNDYEFELIRQKTGTGRGGDPAAQRRADRHARRARVGGHRAACDDRRRRPCRRTASSIRPASATRSAAA